MPFLPAGRAAHQDWLLQFGLPNTRCLKAAKPGKGVRERGLSLARWQDQSGVSALGSQELPLSRGFAPTVLSSLPGFSSVRANRHGRQEWRCLWKGRESQVGTKHMHVSCRGCGACWLEACLPEQDPSAHSRNNLPLSPGIKQCQ